MLFIAEIGLNHNGNFDLAYELIKQAKLAGADIAKFQLGWRGREGEMNHITPGILRKLDAFCAYFEIEFMVSIFTEEAWELSRTVSFKSYKIASRTVRDNPDLVRKIASEGKKTFVSLGMWDRKDLPLGEAPNVKYLWCRSKYPTTPWDLTDFPKDFRNTNYAGYSDHTIGIEVPLMAITRGASVIEKHFTLDKMNNIIRDHTLSATPEEFRIMTELGRNMHRNLDIGV